MLPPEEPLLDKALTVPVQHRTFDLSLYSGDRQRLGMVATEHFCLAVSIQVPLQPLLPLEELPPDEALTVPVQHCTAAEPGHLPISVETEHFCLAVSIQVPLHAESPAGAAIATPPKTGRMRIERTAIASIFFIPGQ